MGNTMPKMADLLEYRGPVEIPCFVECIPQRYQRSGKPNTFDVCRNDVVICTQLKKEIKRILPDRK